MNAYTTYDHTAYFITVPSNKLELFMWMESGRLLEPVFREFYAERDVVFEERRMRTESTPTGKFTESFNSLFWESHPYSWPVIGWPSDIPAISKAQADEFYATYYAPQNLTLILVGDFKSKEALAQAEKYFGRIKKGKDEAPDVVTLEMPQKAEKRFFAEAEINPNVDIYYHTPAFGHKDTFALRVLAQVLHEAAPGDLAQDVGNDRMIWHARPVQVRKAQACAASFNEHLLAFDFLAGIITD